MPAALACCTASSTSHDTHHMRHHTQRTCKAISVVAGYKTFDSTADVAAPSGLPRLRDLAAGFTLPVTRVLGLYGVRVCGVRVCVRVC